MRFLYFVLLMLSTSACAVSSPAAPSSTSLATPASPASAKRITVAIRGDPKTLSAKLNAAAGAGSPPGVTETEELLNDGLAFVTTSGAVHAQLAAEVPSADNGLWQVFDDGRMQTTWKIREGVTWHDGAPFTSADLDFTAQVQQDPDLPIFRDVAYGAVESVAAPDPQTIVVVWKRPFIQADSLFTNFRGLPLPQHLLKTAYEQDKSSIPNLTYWSTDYIGTGPFRLRELVLGSHVTLDANNSFVLGRPKLDSIDVRFIPDPSTLATNVLAGGIDLTLGDRLPIEWTTQVRDQWTAGRMATSPPTTAINLYPQFIDPTPPVLANAQFRKALQLAIDREQLVDTIALGQTQIAHATISQADTLWSAIEPSIITYGYDPLQAGQILAGLGYVRGNDGTLRDSGGQPLSIEIRSTVTDDAQMKTMAATAAFWQQLGITVNQVAVPQQQESDREYRATRPAFEDVRQPGGWQELPRLYGPNAPTAANDYTGINRSRYQNPEFDALIDQFFATISVDQRIDVLRQIMHIETDQLPILGLYWDPALLLVSNRLANVQSSGEVWDAQLWDVS